MTDAQARARVWTLCLAALVLAALTGPIVTLLAPLAHTSAPALHVVAAILAAALVARTWPSPSCASCGPVQTATASPPGSATAALWEGVSSLLQGPQIMALFWYYGGSNGPRIMVPLGRKA